MRGLGVAVGGVALWAVASCAPPGARAPLVEGPVADAARASGTLDAAQRGRALYTTVCTDCHGAIRPASLTTAEWDSVLPKMALKAELSAAEQSDVRAYIDAARAPAATR